MFLLDTNVISELRKRKPHGGVAAWFDRIRDESIQIPAVVIAELQDGAELTRLQDPSKAREIELWIDRIMLTFAVIPMDGAIFREWSRLMVNKSDDLASDGMIAATARVLRLIVVTRNIKHFKPFNVEVFNPFEYSPEEGS
ncbi:MAG: type II toxin-antitoxin system VapC family toxin [Terracidiphilus sp.]